MRQKNMTKRLCAWVSAITMSTLTFTSCSSLGDVNAIKGEGIHGRLSLAEKNRTGEELTVILSAVNADNYREEHEVELSIGKGKTSTDFDIVVGNEGNYLLYYRLTNPKNDMYVEQGFLDYFVPGDEAVNKGEYIIEKGTKVTGTVALDAGGVASGDGMRIILEAGDVVKEVTIPKGQSSAAFSMVIPTGMSTELTGSVVGGNEDGFAQEWVYCSEGIGKGLSTLTPAGEELDLGQIVIPKGRELTATISLPENLKADEDWKVIVRPRYQDRNEDHTQWATPQHATYSGFSTVYTIPAGQSSAEIRMFLPDGIHTFDYQLPDVDVTRIKSKGTFCKSGGSPVIIRTKISHQKFNITEADKFFDIKGRIYLPQGITAKEDLAVHIDVVTQLYAVNKTFVIPGGKNAVEYVLEDMLEGTYTVSYNIVEAKNDYPQIITYGNPTTDGINQLNILTLDKDTVFDFTLALSQNAGESNPVETPEQDRYLEVKEQTVPYNDSPITYYVSNSRGNDDNDGLSEKKPFRSFDPINKLTLKPGDKILLKSGDEWADNLIVRCRATEEQPLVIGAYGKGDKPFIKGEKPESDVLLLLLNCSNIRVEGLRFAEAKLGIFVKYTMPNGKNITIRDCDFQRFTDGPEVKLDVTNDTITRTGGLYGFASAIFLGGVIQDNFIENTILDGWTVEDCTFDYCDGVVTNNWYRQVYAPGRLRNVFIRNLSVRNFTVCAISLNQLTGGTLQNIEIENSIEDVFTEYGICGMFFHGCKDVVIDGYKVAEINRGRSGDGAGIDFEFCDSMTVKNSIIANCDGMGLELLDTAAYVGPENTLADRWLSGYNRNLVIENSVLYNNSRRAHVLPSNEDLMFDVYSRNARTTATFRKVVFVEGKGSHGTFSTKTQLFNVESMWRFDLPCYQIMHAGLL